MDIYTCRYKFNVDSVIELQNKKMKLSQLYCQSDIFGRYTMTDGGVTYIISIK